MLVIQFIMECVLNETLTFILSFLSLFDLVKVQTVSHQFQQCSETECDRRRRKQPAIGKKLPLPELKFLVFLCEWLATPFIRRTLTGEQNLHQAWSDFFDEQTVLRLQRAVRNLFIRSEEGKPILEELGFVTLRVAWLATVSRMIIL